MQQFGTQLPVCFGWSLGRLQPKPPSIQKLHVWRSQTPLKIRIRGIIMSPANTYRSPTACIIMQNICRYLVESASSEHRIVKHMLEVGCIIMQNICRYLVESASSEHQIVKHMLEVGCLATPTTSQQNNGLVPPGCQHTVVGRLCQWVDMWWHVFRLTSSEHVHHLVRNTWFHTICRTKHNKVCRIQMWHR